MRRVQVIILQEDDVVSEILALRYLKNFLYEFFSGRVFRMRLAGKNYLDRHVFVV